MKAERKNIEFIAPEKAPWAAARRAWLAADYDAVVETLKDRRDSRSRLLLARTYLRLRRSADACVVLRGLRSADADEEALASALRLAANPDSASRTALPKTGRLGQVSRPTRAFVTYLGAVGCWAAGDIAEAERLANDTIAFGDAATHALASDLQGWIEVARGRFGLASRRFVEALDVHAAATERDEFARAKSLHGLAVIAVETLEPSLFSRLSAEYASLAPASGNAALYAQVSSYVATAAALEGDDLRCLQILLDARSAPVPMPMRAMLEIDLAAFHRRRGGPDAAGLYLRLAEAHLDATSWAEANIESRIVLLLYAAEAARLGVSSAGAAYTKALSLTGKRDPLLAFEHDDRAMIAALHARGRIAASRRKPADARADFTAALDVSARYDYRFQAAVISVDMAQNAPGDEVPKTLRSAAREFPRSWLSLEAAAIRTRASSPLASINPAEALVLAGVCDGKTSKQIAADLKKSPSTVRNQTHSLLRRFGVRTRTALAAKARTLGPPHRAPRRADQN